MMLVKLLRVKQYTKSILFVPAALIFTREFTHLDKVGLTAAAIAVMCLAGSATYIVNDVVDVERDRAHPKKRNRPIAAGKISISSALVIAALCLIASLTAAMLVRPQLVYCVAFYLALQVLYNLKLKHVAIADVFVIATGFVLRVIVGAVAIHAQLSGWILVCTGSLALLLGFGKRRHEFVEQKEDGWKSRESLTGYSLPLLDGLVVASASMAIMCYGLYCIQSPTAKQYSGLIVTTPFVAFGIFRYMLLIFGDADTGEPESIVVTDRQLAVTFVMYVLVAAWALSGSHLHMLD